MKKLCVAVPEKKKLSQIKAPTKQVANIFTQVQHEGELDEKLDKASNEATMSEAPKRMHFEEMHEKALEEDPNVFCYDEIYENITSDLVKRRNRYSQLFGDTEGRERERETKSPKYIQDLLSKAQERKIEHELIRIQSIKKKNSTTEKEEEQDEEAFVTTGYKAKLKELEVKKMELEALREASERKTSEGNIEEFYLNMMRRNVSLGGQRENVGKLKGQGPKVSVELDEKHDERRIEKMTFGPKRPARKD